MPPYVLVVSISAVLAIGIAAAVLDLSPHRVLTVTVLVIFIACLALSIYGRSPHSSSADDWVDACLQRGPGATLFILVHGLHGPDTWNDLSEELHQHGDVLRLTYNAGSMSNSNPEALARLMDERIAQNWDSNRHQHVVLIGHSIGALLARRTYLLAAKAQRPWISPDNRIVLLAGMNRGWDFSGRKPMDMNFGTLTSFSVGAWFGRLTGTGRMILQAETGAPFVANLRLQWMRWFQQNRDHAPLVVQLLGDIDDIVSNADNQDLRAAAPAGRFYWLRVRGTGHSDILRIKDTTGKNSTYAGIGAYRKSKILLAATGPAEDLAAVSEEQAFPTDPRIQHIVFVLHGIRDLGEWSAEFEEKLRERLPPSQPGTLAVVSVRYGYFSMGSFLLRPDRQKYVRWFMDQYTETLARYPNATRIDFIGHSNGTYLLASALDQYTELKINRIVFAGSVVRQDYCWPKLLGTQVHAVRNYVSTDDAVVALFPRFFEPWNKHGLFGNDVGSAGFNRFTQPDSNIFQQVSISGGHSAFLGVASQIADYLMDMPHSPRVDPPGSSTSQSLWPKLLAWHSRYFFFVIPGLIIVAVLFPAVRVATAGGSQAWTYLAAYLILVITLLATL
jgi:pimeloyl-ACP methyl ester carboxylesterase